MNHSLLNGHLEVKLRKEAFEQELSEVQIIQLADIHTGKFVADGVEYQIEATIGMYEDGDNAGEQFVKDLQVIPTLRLQEILEIVYDGEEFDQK